MQIARLSLDKLRECGHTLPLQADWKTRAMKQPKIQRTADKLEMLNTHCTRFETQEAIEKKLKHTFKAQINIFKIWQA